MKRYVDQQVRDDLQKKLVILTGPRQVGKTTLSRQLIEDSAGGQYLNFDVAAHRAVIQAQSWLKGVHDGRSPGQAVLVTGSARMDTFRQTGESLAGRYCRLRMHPLSVREWCDAMQVPPQNALAHLLARGGFPETALAANDLDAQRWRADYFAGLVREDVLEFSRLQEVNAMRLLAEMLRYRVGSPLSLASMARDLHLSPVTLGKCLDILEALFIVFVVRPWHRNIARATLQAPKVYFYDAGLVLGDDGLRLENLVASHLLKNVQWQQDTRGAAVDLHYIRTKDEAEVDFCLSEGDTLTHLVECKLSDPKPHRALTRFAEQWPEAQASQLLRECKAEAGIGRLYLRAAAPWLAALEV
jgi:predicted AAA+ superfamily ATPase